MKDDPRFKILDYNSNEMLPRPYMMKSPYVANRQLNYTQIWGTVGWRLVNNHKTSIEIASNNYTRFFLEEDNQRLGNYLKSQIENDNNFVIPQTEKIGTILSSVVLMINQITEGTLFSTGGIQSKYENNMHVKHLWNILNITASSIADLPE